MSATVWVQSGEDVGQAQHGDALLVPTGAGVRIGDVTEGGTVVWHEVAAELLPGVPDAGEQPAPVEDPALVQAVQGVLTAERNRGG